MYGGKVILPECSGIALFVDPPKVVSPNIWVPYLFPPFFPYIFPKNQVKKMYGEKGRVPKCWGMPLRIDPSENDIPQHSGSSFVFTPPHQYRW